MKQLHSTMTRARSNSEDTTAPLKKILPPPLVVKDQKYLNNLASSGFAWNNKYRTNAKNYKFYHQYNERALPSIKSLEHEEVEAKKMLERARLERLAENRAHILNCFQDRAQERKFMEVKSHQTSLQPSAHELDRMMQSHEQTLVKKAIAAKHAVHTDNKWNYLLEHDQKRCDLYIRPQMLEAEGKLMNHVHKKLQEEAELEAKKEMAAHEKRNEIRRSFAAQRRNSVGEAIRIQDNNDFLKSHEDLGSSTVMALVNALPETGAVGSLDSLEGHQDRTTEGLAAAFRKTNSIAKSASSRLGSNSQLSSSKDHRRTSRSLIASSSMATIPATALENFPKALSLHMASGNIMIRPSTSKDEIDSEGKLVPSKPSTQRSRKSLSKIESDVNLQTLRSELDQFELRNERRIKYSGFPRCDLEAAKYQHQKQFGSASKIVSNNNI